MKKTYNNAELQIVRLNKRDIIATSDLYTTTISEGIFDADAPGMRGLYE